MNALGDDEVDVIKLAIVESIRAALDNLPELRDPERMRAIGAAEEAAEATLAVLRRGPPPVR